jgi:hypothetical protein
VSGYPPLHSHATTSTSADAASRQFSQAPSDPIPSNQSYAGVFPSEPLHCPNPTRSHSVQMATKFIKKGFREKEKEKDKEGKIKRER